jgi:hypothetical protein
MPAQRILYLHGYGTAISSFFQKPLASHRGFQLSKAFNETNTVLDPFDWSIPTHLDPWSALNPLAQLNIYLEYRRALQNQSLLKKLSQRLNQDQPTTIVCHSLGCQLLLNYVQNYQLPASVKKIIFLQADISYNAPIDFELDFINVFCPWDLSLFFSSLYHLQWRAGLVGLKLTKTKNQKNVFFPALRWGNPHTAVLEEVERLEQLLST